MSFKDKALASVECTRQEPKVLLPLSSHTQSLLQVLDDKRCHSKMSCKKIKEKIMIRMNLKMVPPTATHQQKKYAVVGGRAIQYDPETVKNARAEYRAHVAEYVPANPLEGPLVLSIRFYFRLKGKHTDGEAYTNKPDCDNAAKLLQDVLTETGFWKDDSQVFSLGVEKYWSSVPHVEITIHTLEEIRKEFE